MQSKCAYRRAHQQKTRQPWRRRLRLWQVRATPYPPARRWGVERRSMASPLANGSERMTVVAGLVHPSPMWHRRGRAPRARILRLRVNAEMRPDETQPPSTRVGARRFRNRSDPTRKAPRPRRASVAFGTPPASPPRPLRRQTLGRSKKRACCLFSCTKMRN